MRNIGSRARRLKTAGARQSWTKEAATYKEEHLMILAVREAVQNSLDSVRTAIAQNLISKEDAFIAIYLDETYRRLIIQDSGIGFNQARMDKFLTLLGSEKQDASASGGWGVAKAVIFSISESFKAYIRSHNSIVPVSGFVDDQSQNSQHQELHNLPYQQGAVVCIEDINPEYLSGEVDGSWTYSSTLGDVSLSRSTLNEAITILLSCVGTDIPLYFSTTDDLIQMDDAYWRLKSMVIDHPRKNGLEPITRMFNTGEYDDTPYINKPMQTIDPRTGRATRKKSPSRISGNDQAYIDVQAYMQDLRLCSPDFKRLIKGREDQLFVCIRLNGMFMFFTRTHVTSIDIRKKIILFDITTNIKPYQTEAYPVTKTREELTSSTAQTVRELTKTLDQEALSSGSNYLGQIIMNSNTSGLTKIVAQANHLFIKKIDNPDFSPPDFFQFRDVNRPHVPLLNYGVPYLGGTDHSTRLFLQNFDIYYGQAVTVDSSQLSWTVPTCKNGHNSTYLSILMNKLEYVLTDMKNLVFDTIRHLNQQDDEDAGSFEQFNTYIDFILKSIKNLDYSNLNDVWELFLSRPDASNYLFEFKSDHENYTRQLMPPMHFLVMDIRDVFGQYRFLIPRFRCGFGFTRSQDLKEILYAEMNVLASAFSSNYHYRSCEDIRSWNWNIPGDVKMDLVRNARSRLVDVLLGASYDTNGRMHQPDEEAYSYSGDSYDTSGELFSPRLQLTKFFFEGRKISRFRSFENKSKQRYTKKIASILDLMDNLELIGESSGRDGMGIPIRIQSPKESVAELMESGQPFALVDTYDKTRLKMIILSTLDLDGSQRPPLFLSPSRYATPEHPFVFEFLVSSLIKSRDCLVSRMVSNFLIKDVSQIKDTVKQLNDFNKDFKKILKLLPKSQYYEKTLIVNPYEGFCPIKMNLDAGQRDFNKVSNAFLNDIPILAAWSAIIGVVDRLSTHVWWMNGKSRDKYKISPALDFTWPSKALANAQYLGEGGAILFINVPLFKEKLSHNRINSDLILSHLYSLVVHEYAHLIFSSAGHNQDYSSARDAILDATLAHVEYIYRMAADILGINQPMASRRQMELEAKLAVRQQEIKSLKQQNKRLKKNAKKK